MTLRFSTDRAVGEHPEQPYLPAAAAYRLRSSNSGAIGNARIASHYRRLCGRSHLP